MKFPTIFSIFFALTTVAGNATSINLGPAADYGVLGINGAAVNTGASVHLSSGPLVVNGNVGSGDNGQFQADGGGHINGRLDFAPVVKDLANAGFSLVGGRAEYLDSRRVAALAYNRRRHVINLFIWPDLSGDEARFARDGYNVLHWSDAGMS